MKFITCKQCNLTLPVSHFNKQHAYIKRTGKMAYNHTCKVCWKIKYFDPDKFNQEIKFKMDNIEIKKMKESMIKYCQKIKNGLERLKACSKMQHNDFIKFKKNLELIEKSLTE